MWFFSVVTSVDILEDALRELRLDGVLKIKHTPGRHTNQAYATGRTTPTHGSHGWSHSHCFESHPLAATVHTERLAQLKPTTTAFEVATGDFSSHDDPQKLGQLAGKAEPACSENGHLRDSNSLPEESPLGASAGGHAQWALHQRTAEDGLFQCLTLSRGYVPKTNSNSCSARRGRPQKAVLVVVGFL